MNDSAINLLQGFAKHQKLQNSSKRLFETSVSTYKLIRNITLYLFDLLHTVNILPQPFMTPFKAAKSAFRIFFETGDIISRGMKIYHSLEKKELGLTKIKKWASLEEEIQSVRYQDQGTLDLLKNKYELKLNKLSDDSIAISLECSNRWLESLDLINRFLKEHNEEDIQNLSTLLSKRRTQKLEKWNTYQEQQNFHIKKSIVEIAYSLLVIAIEALSLVALALGVASGYLIAGRVVGVISAEVIDLGKLTWCEMRKRDNPLKIVAHSIESILVMLVETKILSESSLLQKSFIKGFSATYLACKKIPLFRNEIKINHTGESLSKSKVEKLRHKRAQLIALEKAIQHGNFEALAEAELKKYEDKKNELEDNINACSGAEWIGKANAKIQKLNGLIAIYAHIVIDKDKKNFEDNVASKLLSVRRKISNWKLNSDRCQIQNDKAAVSIAMNVVEIARFALLGIAITLTLLQFGINFLPIVLSAGVVANILYVGYLIFISKTNSKEEKILNAWEKDEVIDSVVLDPNTITSMIANTSQF